MIANLDLRQAILDVHRHLGAGLCIEAETACREILSAHPHQFETLVNYSVTLLQLGRFDEALLAADGAIAIRPDVAEAHNARANALFRRGHFDLALAAYDRAIDLRPDKASFHSNRASALQAVSRLDDAIAACDRALLLQPGLEPAEANRLFAMLFHPAYGPDEILREQRLWAERLTKTFPPDPRPHLNDRSPDRRLRVGYVSPDLRDHCLGHLMLPIVREHDRDAVEVFCYSDAAAADTITQQFRAASAQWRETFCLSHAALAEQIRLDRIDVLVDLTLHMAGSRLPIFALKPAPVQVTYGGYPGGTGLHAMDYRLTDPYLDPPGETDGAYLERSVRLPDSFWVYSPPRFSRAAWLRRAQSSRGPLIPPTSDPETAELPADQTGYVTFGCLNNFCKVNAPVLRLWSRVMRAVPRSRLLLLAPPGDARHGTLRSLEDHGIAPDRIEFTSHQPRKTYLRTYDRIDIALDTFPYNGHVTSLDAFWMGVPVVTLVGRRAVGRAGWSLLCNLGLTELAAGDEDQFISIASLLANDRSRLRDLRRGLRARMRRSPLMDARGFTRNLEAAYRHAWRRWCGPARWPAPK